MSTLDQFMTPVKVPVFHPKIRYPDPVMFIGSCFAEHISDKLNRYKYDILANPFGILYNPVSMARSLERIVHKQHYRMDELVLHHELFHSMDHHGSFSGKNPDAVVQKINASIDQAHAHLKKSSFVFISPGTSKVYLYKPTDKIVGNCHKIPQAIFEYRQLRVEECIAACEEIESRIKQLSPDAHIIWTVSPVRHTRDGLVENQRSKATLILAIHECLVRQKGSGYFPSYEIMMDQLRDYRYYARDMVHPSDVAVDMIWQIFADTYLDLHECEHHASIEKIKRAMEHRFLHDDPEAIKSFARGQLKQIDHLATILPNLNWQQERQYFFQYLELD